MSPNLIHFKAHLRVFHGDPINWTSGDIKWGWRLERRVVFSKEERVGNVIGVQGLRGLDLWHIISFFFFYFHDYEL